MLDLNLRNQMSTPAVDLLRGRNVPVILCSGYGDLPEMKGVLAGVPTMSKPCEPEQLVAEMARQFAVARKAG